MIMILFRKSSVTPPPPYRGGVTPPPYRSGATPPPPPYRGGVTPPPYRSGATPPPPPIRSSATPPRSGATPPPPTRSGATPPPPRRTSITPPSMRKPSMTSEATGGQRTSVHRPSIDMTLKVKLETCFPVYALTSTEIRGVCVSSVFYYRTCKGPNPAGCF